MDFYDFINNITKELAKPLPGFDSQLKMSSLKRIRQLMNVSEPENSIPSGVLILFYPFQESIYTVFMLRPDYGGVHSGQISLPGGRYEQSDKDLKETALREANEELGINPESVHLIGRLSDLYIPPSRYLVSPFIGYAVSRPDFVKDPCEVEEIIEINIGDLFSEDAYQVRKHKVELGIQIMAPAFVIDNHVIWGATAMILSELKDVTVKFLSVD